jgi:hypothetical protein
MQRQKSPLSDYDDSEGTGWLSGPRSSLFRSHRRIGGSRRAWLVEAEEEKRLEETTNYVVGFLHACILLPCQQVHFRVSCYWSRPSIAHSHSSAAAIGPQSSAGVCRRFRRHRQLGGHSSLSAKASHPSLTFLAFPSQPVRIFTCFSFPGNHFARPISKASYRPIHARLLRVAIIIASPIGLFRVLRNRLIRTYLQGSRGSCCCCHIGRSMYDNGLRRSSKKDSILSIQYRGVIAS